MPTSRATHTVARPSRLNATFANVLGTKAALGQYVRSRSWKPSGHHGFKVDRAVWAPRLFAAIVNTRNIYTQRNNIVSGKIGNEDAEMTVNLIMAS